MKLDLFGWEVDVELPADPEAFVKGKVIEILSYLGYEWPTTDVGVLEGWSADWTSLAGRLESYVRDLEAGVAHLRGANEGLAVESVVGHLSGGEGS